MLPTWEIPVLVAAIERKSQILRIETRYHRDLLKRNDSPFYMLEAISQMDKLSTSLGIWLKDMERELPCKMLLMPGSQDQAFLVDG